jgi:hypothetical protein
MLDKYLHGTAPVGENNPRALLKEQEVKYVRDHPRTYGSRLALARQFNVSSRVIDKIRSGESWKYVS